jgi:tryptophan halogenase
MIHNVTILGGGSAGFLSALAIKSKLPQLRVEVLRSPDIGIIGVGEGSTAAFTRFLHNFLVIDRAKFFEIARPTWKLGLKFIWGKRPSFNYTFGPGLEARSVPQLMYPNGYYCADNIEFTDPYSAMMSLNKAFEQKDGLPVVHGSIAYHFENEKFVRYLELYARSIGVEIRDTNVTSVLTNENGVEGLMLDSGEKVTADLYVDASGFRSELLGKALAEPFISFNSTLFCDRAVVGGWDRGPDDQVIQPYTTCETMDSGWCWQIEHENRVNRGYVYSSAFISDNDAEMEFRRKNPKVSATRIVRFISGRYERAWVKNVVAVGNASGFVEPLEATALGIIGVQNWSMLDALTLSACDPGPMQRKLFNRFNAINWDSVRGFLGIHYRFNDRLETPFWKHCRQHTDLAGASDIAECYQEIGPDGSWGNVAINAPHDQFTIGGYITMMAGMRVPFARKIDLSQSEMNKFEIVRSRCREMASRGMSVRDALNKVHQPTWKWQ